MLLTENPVPWQFFFHFCHFLGFSDTENLGINSQSIQWPKKLLNNVIQPVSFRKIIILTPHHHSIQSNFCMTIFKYTRFLHWGRIFFFSVKKISGAEFFLNQKTDSYKMWAIPFPSFCMKQIFDLGQNKGSEFFLQLNFYHIFTKMSSQNVWEKIPNQKLGKILYLIVFSWVPCDT